MKILWAVDALDPDFKGMEKIAEVLRRFGKTIEMEIQPIFMLSPEQLGIAMEISAPPLQTYLETNSRKALDHCMRDIQIPGLKRAETLIHHRHSFKGSVKKLAEYAADQKYDLLVTASHGRKGLQRVAIGSFTEELLLQAKVPVLVVGPNIEIGVEASNRILIPNDLGHIDSPFFQESFKLAKLLKAKATLLHAIPRPVEAFVESGIYLFSGGWVPVTQYLNEEKSKQELIVDKLRAVAMADGIECDSVIDHNCASITDSILAQAKDKKINLIAMAAQSGPVSAALLGSVARKVIRDAPCPVWVMRQR